MEECTKKQTRISYARILVDINITQEHPNEIMIIDLEGRTITQPAT